MCYFYIFYFIRLAGVCIYSKIRAFLSFGGKKSAEFAGGRVFATSVVSVFIQVLEIWQKK